MAWCVGCGRKEWNDGAKVGGWGKDSKTYSLEGEGSLEKEIEVLCQPHLNILLLVIALIFSENRGELVFCIEELNV